MYRSQVIRTLRTSFRPVFLNPGLSRAYTVPPPSGQAAPNRKVKHADNTLVYTTLGLVAAASAYYYFFRNTEEAQEFKDKAKAEQDYMKSKGGELAGAAKGRAEDVKQQGKAKWEQVKTGGKEKLGSAETRVADLEGTAKEKATRARDSTENLYNEARSLSEQKAGSAQDQGKNGWSSWFNWGKSKADDIESEAEPTAENVKE